MKIKLILTFLIISVSLAHAQTSEPSDAFDFWVGEWKLEWDDGDGKMGRGTNTISKILDDRVIQENFVATEGRLKGFKGTSISVFNPRNNRWHQAWADNQGGYFNFVGEVNDDRKIFTTEARMNNGKTIIQRMVFYDFTKNGFTWDWENSNDNGETWNLNWRINYSKK